MAQVLNGNTVKLSNGKTVAAQQGGWYDGQQFWGGTLSAPGVINSQSNQVGAGQAVSKEVNRQTSVAAGLAPNANQDYINKLNAQGVQGSAPVQQPVQQPAASASYDQSSGMGSGVSGIGSAAAVQPIDLPAIYKNLYASSGVNELQQKLSAEEQAFNDAQSKINDNPFLSEATRIGRVQKLQTDYNNNTAGIRNDIATKKADVETQLAIQQKQFDINSQASRDALSRLNSLLSMGALSGASGEDIASLTMSTGIPSGLIQNAIKASQAKNLDTQVITSTDDNGNVTASVINKQTGEIIAKNSLGAIGNAQKGSSGTAAGKKSSAIATATQVLDQLKNSYGHVSPSDWATVKSAALQSGLTTAEFNDNFGGYADPNRRDFNTSYGFDIKNRGTSHSADYYNTDIPYEDLSKSL